MKRHKDVWAHGHCHQQSMMRCTYAWTSMQVGMYKMHRGTEVHVSIWCLHHNEQWWQDAEVFKPERWIGDKTGGDKSGGLAFIPFGTGPRMCVGYKLARRFPSLPYQIVLHSQLHLWFWSPDLWSFELSSLLSAQPVGSWWLWCLSRAGYITITVQCTSSWYTPFLLQC